MKVALEAGEVLEVAVLDGDKVVGTLSLQLKTLSGASSAVKRGRPAGASEKAESAEPARKRRKQRKPLSDETKARMAAAQKARWEQINANKAANESGNA